MTRFVWLLGLLWACGGPRDRATAPRPDGGPADVGPADAGRVDSGGPPSACGPADRRGDFVIESTESYSSVSGIFLTRRNAQELNAQILEAGDCRYFEAGMVTCSPRCSAGTQCVRGACLPPPRALDVGTVRITGEREVELPRQAGGHYWLDDNQAGLLLEGQTGRLTATGSAEVEAFALEIRGVGTLDRNWDQLTVREGEDAVLTWVPGAARPDERVAVRLDSDHHGIFAAIECDAPRSAGMIVIPALLVDAIIEAGRTGIGTFIENATMSLESRDQTTTNAGCATFRAQSLSWFSVETIVN